MYKLTPLQKETMEFLKAQIDEARSYSIDFEIWEKKICKYAKNFGGTKGQLFIRRVEM